MMVTVLVLNRVILLWIILKTHLLDILRIFEPVLSSQTVTSIPQCQRCILLLRRMCQLSVEGQLVLVIRSEQLMQPSLWQPGERIVSFMYQCFHSQLQKLLLKLIFCSSYEGQQIISFASTCSYILPSLLCSMKDGRLLKPTHPAMSIDSTFVQRAFGSGGPDGQLWATFTEVCARN